MAIKFTTTKAASKYIKCLVYGESGRGKTWLIKTAPNPLIISAEGGLLTLGDCNFPVIEIKTYDDLVEAYDFIMTDEKAKKFETICFDSISDVAENVISDLKKEYADPRQAYGDMADKILAMVKKFRDIPDRHVYIIAKEKRVKDEYTGITSWQPSAPGQQIGPALPYLFDFVLALRIGETAEGVQFRYLQTVGDIQYIAKARCVHPIANKVEPHLGKLFSMALGEKVTNKPESQSTEVQADEPEKGEEVEEPEAKTKTKKKKKEKK